MFLIELTTNLSLPHVCSILDRKIELHDRIGVIERVNRLLGETGGQVDNQVLDWKRSSYFRDLVVVLIFLLCDSGEQTK
jgi:hypothetical protein